MEPPTNGAGVNRRHHGIDTYMFLNLTSILHCLYWLLAGSHVTIDLILTAFISSVNVTTFPLLMVKSDGPLQESSHIYYTFPNVGCFHAFIYPEFLMSRLSGVKAILVNLVSWLIIFFVGQWFVNWFPSISINWNTNQIADYATCSCKNSVCNVLKLLEEQLVPHSVFRIPSAMHDAFWWVTKGLFPVHFAQVLCRSCVTMKKDLVWKRLKKTWHLGCSLLLVILFS
jgi:hypothetical protein